MRWRPKINKSKRLVVTRVNCGVGENTLYLYQIWRITKLGNVDKRFKPLFAITDRDFQKIPQFFHSKTGEAIKIAKTQFKTVTGVYDVGNPESIWKLANHF